MYHLYGLEAPRRSSERVRERVRTAALTLTVCRIVIFLSSALSAIFSRLLLGCNTCYYLWTFFVFHLLNLLTVIAFENLGTKSIIDS
jgi:hypothetical protein